MIDTNILLFGIGGLVIGMFLAFLLYGLYLKQKKISISELIQDAEKQAEQQKKDILLRFREEIQKKRNRFYEELKSKEKKYARNEQRVFQKEKELRRFENNLKIRESKYNIWESKLNENEELLHEKNKRIDNLLEMQNQKLEKISGLSIDDAKKHLLNNLESQVKLEAAQMAIDLKNEARESAQREAKEIIAQAIENLAYEFTMESTLSTVQLPNERFKGMIIGREGRNIRAFEEVTGVKVIIDDTPEMIVLSAFDPVQREIARITMETMIKSKNISPKAIEQNYRRAQKEVERTIFKSAEEVLRELRIRDLHPKIKECLGRLKYRYSYGQNMLQHAREVALLSGSMAAELGFNVKLARRAGLLHDIGKALTSNSEGSHVELGVELCEKYKEHEVVINSILAHHEEAEPISPISVLVTAADKISGSRPGARRDTLEAYTKRIKSLEDIANSFDGVSKSYAISAGREIRVIVEPESVDDKKSEILASDIASKIKEGMEYPGNIKICVIRQTISSKLTDEYEDQNGQNGLDEQS